MKILLFIFLTLAIGTPIYGQTDSTERIKLNEKLAARDISKGDYSFILKKWNEALETNEYPRISLNEAGKIQYSYIIEPKELSKTKLFNRILEWLVITYGIVPAYLYSNQEDGKIICSNSVAVNGTAKVTFAYVFSISESKVLIDFENISYQVTGGGYYSGDSWMPETMYNADINSVFPIVLKNMSKWTYYFDILKTMDNQFKRDLEMLNEFLTSYDLKYK